MGEINWKNKCWVTTIYLVNPRGKVLLTWNKSLQTWIPVGGHIEPGENPIEAITREVKEETALKEFDFIPKNKNYEEAALTGARVQIEKVKHHNQHINIVFYGKCNSPIKNNATDENEKLRWFSLKELKENRKEFMRSVYERSVIAIKKAGF